MAPPLQDLLHFSDVELCDKLRREDPEQYVTLVRMHLSFVLDLSSDEEPGAPEKSRSAGFRALKWVSRGRKPSAGGSRGIMEGAPLTQEGICQVYQLIEFLSRESNISQEGVFRRSGKLTRQQELKTLLNNGANLNLDEGCFSVHDCASVLKGFLAELPEPLLTDAHYQAYCQVAEMCDGADHNRLVRALQLLLLLLPTENRSLLSDVLRLLHLAASHESTNKMSADNLATLFTPHLLCPRKLAPEELHVNSQVMSRVVSFMISRGLELFEVPPKLATDIRAYWADHHRKQQQESRGEEVNTVFSFVDRQLTAAANSSNPTEAALANLYAHIQSLPESAHKRRLVKQFNRENGHGTPLHVRHKQSQLSRSLGDSIKKHIFTKKRHKQANVSADELAAAKSPKKPMEPVPVPQDKDEELRVSIQPLPISPLAAASSQESQPPQITSQESEQQSSEVPQESTGLSPQSVTFSPSQVSQSSPVPSSQEPSLLPTILSSQELVTSPASSPKLSQEPPLSCRSVHFPQEVLAVSPHVGKSPAVSSWSSLQMATSTPAACSHNMSMPADRSMSPITRSTHRMPRAMQETMMTPRSRKPVLVLSSSNLAAHFNDQESSSSLTSTFREYLLSRSVLTASPVSLSAAASPDKLSSSLLYCLDGHEPSSSANESSSSSRKRSADSSLFADHSISLSSDSAKKSTLESSYTSTLGSCVRETSL